MSEWICENCNGTGHIEQYRRLIACSTCDGTGKLGKPAHPLSIEAQGGWKWWHFAALVIVCTGTFLQFALFFPDLFGW